jgi:hypothetical protein
MARWRNSNNKFPSKQGRLLEQDMKIEKPKQL